MIRSCLFSLACWLCVGSLATHLLSAERTVTVSGNGSVKVPPDEVAVDLELKAVDDDLVRVRTNSDQQVRAILELAQKHGVEPDDFEVSRMKLGLSYNEQLKRRIYHVERSMSVRLGELTNLNALLAELLKQPDAAVGQIRFGVNKPREHELEARRLAVADAKATAENLAELNGLKLGKAVRIQTYQEHSRPFVTSVDPAVGQADPFGIRRLDRNDPAVVRSEGPTQEQAGTSAAFVIAFLAAQGAAEEGGQAAFGLGLIEFGATVSIVFELLE